MLLTVDFETIIEIETWLPIPGYEDLYTVSDQGRVRSIDRVVKQSNGRVFRLKGKLLKPAIHSKGYKSVPLHIAGGSKTRLVHSLVLEAFVGPRPDGYDCCHGDGDPANNTLGNLRWDTRSANSADTLRHGNNENANRTHCPRLHPLIMPNLVPSSLRRGLRGCLSCSRAHSVRSNARVAGKPEPDMQVLSDRHFVALAREYLDTVAV